MIGYYQNLIAEQERRKKRFKNLKTSLSGAVVPALTKTYDDLISASNFVNLGFTVDGEGGDGESIKNNASSVSDTKSKITSSVYSEIDKEISKCDSKISYYYAKIREIRAEQESGE